MTPLRQTNSTNCGQTCAAMLLGITVKESEILFGHDGITTKEEVLKVLDTKFPKCFANDFFGKIKYRNRDSTKWRVFLCLHQNPKNKEQKHWTICEDSVIIDPAGRKESEIWPMVRHWIIYTKRLWENNGN